MGFPRRISGRSSYQRDNNWDFPEGFRGGPPIKEIIIEISPKDFGEIHSFSVEGMKCHNLLSQVGIPVLARLFKSLCALRGELKQECPNSAKRNLGISSLSGAGGIRTLVQAWDYLAFYVCSSIFIFDFRPASNDLPKAYL